MATTQQLRDQRAAAWAQAQEYNALNGRGDDMSAEDEASWARALADVDHLGEQIQNRERSGALEALFAQVDEQARAEGAGAGAPQGVTNDAERYRSAFAKFCRGGTQALDADEAAMVQARFAEIQNAQGGATGAAGGYTVPEGFWAKATETMKYFGGAAAGAELVTTTTGAALPWPTNDDTSNVGYILGENTVTSNEGDLSFGQKTLGAYTFVSGPIRASLQLIQDSGVDIEAFLARKMGERLGRAQNAKFTTGSGSSQPQGYVTGLSTGKTTASATAITYDEIVDLVHSVDAAYRGTGRCQFKMHDLVLAYVRKIRDESGGAGVGRPIWEPSVQAGQPDTLLGHAVTINNDQDSAITASKVTMAFGDFQSAFAVRRVVGGQLMRLTERYADYLQVGFIAYERADAIVQDASAVKLLTQHS